MTAQPKSVIKSYFETGDKPTQAQFADLVDSYQDASGGKSFVTGVSASVTNGLVIFTNTSGNAVKGVANSGVVIVTSGVVSTPAGTIGQLLTSNGPGLAPTFQAQASSGSLVLLSSANATNVATLDITANIDGTYLRYFVEIDNLLPLSNQDYLTINLKQGSSFVSSSNYSYGNVIQKNSGTPTADVGTSQTSFRISTTPGFDSTTPAFGEVRLSQAAAALIPVIDWNFSSKSGGTSATIEGNGFLAISGAYTGIRFAFASGNITGIFKLYGLT